MQILMLVTAIYKVLCNILLNFDNSITNQELYLQIFITTFQAISTILIASSLIENGGRIHTSGIIIL